MAKLELKYKTVKELLPSTPFNFDATFFKPDHFTSGDNFWQPSTRWQTWNQDGRPIGLKFRNSGTVEKPRIELTIYSDRKLDESRIDRLVKEIRFRYNLDLDLGSFYKQFGDDTILGPVIKRLWGMRPGHPSSLYEYLIIGVVLQNAAVRRSIQMFKSLLENYGTQLQFDGKELWSFWEPGRLRNVSEQELRDLKVGYRAKFIKKIDEQFDAGLINEVDLRSKDAEIEREELLKLYGVGPATVWYLLFDVFHHFEIFDHISPWEQKIYSKIFFDRDPEKPVPVPRLLKYIKQYGQYKHLAVHYIWEDLWWRRKNGEVMLWLEKEIRV